MRPDDAIPDAPVYTATLAEMENLEELLAKANEIAMQYGAVRIDPPSTWAQPPLRMSPKSRFFVRMQTLPAAPFAHPQLVNHVNPANNHPRKRARRNTLTTLDEDSDHPVPEPKLHKTTARDRAARAASRSQRNLLKPCERNKQALLHHLANADFHSERIPPQTTLETPPNPHSTPIPSPPPELRRPVTKLPSSSTEPPSLPTPQRQAFARPSSREPCTQPSSASSGQSQAVREAALRLAEAFPGSAQAGPVQDATSIPPCPFSQQTAQEHIAKRTAVEQTPFPVQKAVPAHPPAPPTLPAATSQATVPQEHNALATGSSCEPVGEVFGSEARVRGIEALINPDTKPCATTKTAVLPNIQKANVMENLSKREAERKDRSRLALGRYIDGKNDEAVLLDDTRIPRINKVQSISPFAAPNQSSMRNPWILPRGVGSCSNNAARIPFGPPQNGSNKVAPTFPGMQPFIRKEPPVNNQTVPFAYHNAKQPWLTGIRGCETGNQIQPDPSASRNVHSREDNGRIPHPVHIPMLRSFPLQPYGSRPPVLHPIVTGREIESRHGQVASETNATAPQQKELLQTRDTIIAGSAGKGAAASSLSPVLDKSSAAEKPSIECQDARPLKTTPETKAQKKEPEHPNAGCAAKMEAVIPSRDQFKTENNSTCDEIRKREQRQMPHVPSDAALPSDIPSSVCLKAEDNSNQCKEAVLVTNVVKPPTEATEISNERPSKPFTEELADLGAHPPTSQPASHIPLIDANRSFSPKPREAAVVSGADRLNALNSCLGILEEILAIATRSVDTEPLRTEQHKREEGVKTLELVATRPEQEQAAANQRPNDQPTAEAIHASNSTGGTSPVSQRIPKSCRDEECVFVGETQTRAETNICDSRAHAHSRLPNKLTSLEEQQSEQRNVAHSVSGKPLPAVPKGENAEVPELIAKGSSPYQQASSPANLRDSNETMEDVVVVAERKNVQHRNHPSMNRPKPEDVICLDEQKPSISESKPDTVTSKPTSKRTTKRKPSFKTAQVDQDEVGRLTKAIVFPDSVTPISLASYEKKAHEHHDGTRKALNGQDEERMSEPNVENVMSKLDLYDVDTLETEFWKAMSAGIGGRPITVAYGVDVEAEGAFDSNGMSYVEWHGAESTGQTTKKRKRGRPRGQKRIMRGSKDQLVEKTRRQSNIEALGTCPDEIHEDAYDGMDYDDDSIIERSEPRAQIEEIKSKPRGHKNKRLKSPLPRSHVGTLNRDGILRHMPRMPGINHSMYYVGQLFTRFCWHTEDAFLNSVSYLHPGSAEKVWYAVPPRFAPAFEDYAAASVFSPTLLENENAGRVLLMNKTTMFDPRRVRRKGVAVFRVVHKPGSFVLTAPRAYHAGFNCGFNIAEAVNFANPTWFPVGRKASLFARQAIKPLCVPWEYLLFHEAKSLRDISNGISKRAPCLQRLESNAAVVAKEFKAIIIDGEQKIRKYAEARNCRVSMLHEISKLATHNQLGPEFGNGAGMVCSLCSHACHFYAEMCGSCDDTFEARCVDHFGKGHKLCLYDSHKTVIVRRHDPVLLLDVLGCLERIAGIKVDAHELAQRYVGYLRTWQTPLRTSGLRLRLDLKAATSRLPPKVCKEKSDREKIVKAKIVRDKGHREKRRKIRKPVGTLVRTGEKGKRSVHTKAEILGGVDVFTPVETNHTLESGGGRDSRRAFGDARDAMSGIHLY